MITMQPFHLLFHNGYYCSVLKMFFFCPLPFSVHFFLYLGFCLTSWRLTESCLLPPISTLCTLLCVSWEMDLSGLPQETDLCGLHPQAPLPSSFWWDSANERHSRRSGDQKKVRTGCLFPRLGSLLGCHSSCHLTSLSITLPSLVPLATTFPCLYWLRGGKALAFPVVPGHKTLPVAFPKCCPCLCEWFLYKALPCCSFEVLRPGLLQRLSSLELWWSLAVHVGKWDTTWSSVHM